MKKTYLILLFTVTCLFSCNVIEQEPVDAVSSTQLFTRPSDADAAIVGVYNQLAANGFNYIVMNELPTKNTLGNALNRQFEQFNNLQFLDDNPFYEIVWNENYLLINRANVVINRVPGIPGMTDAAKNAIIAEARFLRAFTYFNLVRYYGDVPLVTTPTETTDIGILQVSRTAKEEVYKQIFEDLNFAKINLPDAYANTLATKARATKLAAFALGSRIYLARKEYSLALADANAVTKVRNETLKTPYQDLFLTKNSEESIMEINYDAQLQNSLATNFVPASLGGVRAIQVNPDIFTAYETGDLRKDATYGFADRDNYVKKYARGRTRDDNVILFRLAEVLLNKSEALAETAYPSADALKLLNEVRRRAGLVAINPVNIEAFRTALYKERRLELCFEGLAWFDLVRTNRLEKVLGIKDINKSIWPVPAVELARNPKLRPQNPSY